MLKTYIEKYKKNNFQYILIDTKGKIIEVDNLIVPLKPNMYIQESHPFFEVINDLILVKNQTYNFICIYLNFDDTSIIADISIYTQSNNNCLIIIEDLTHHYNSYQLAAQSRNESVINSQVLELKNKYLIEKEQFKDKFIENFSHQLRNPITASTIFSDLLINTELNSEQKSYADIILSANRDLKNRIGDILDISVLESGKLVLHEKIFNLKLFLSELTSGYKLVAVKKKLEFYTDIDQKIPEFIEGDQYRLKQIIGNLINNAIIYTLDGSIKLCVSLNQVRANKANICIKVIDTGIGIESKNLDAIFERFTKIESTVQNDKNIGLGLSITRHLVSEMGGNMKVESELNAGSVFTCNISFKISSYNNSLKQELLLKQHSNLNNKKNILLVEDSELIQLSILKILASEGSFYVNIVTNGECVIPTIINQDIDLILISNTIQGHTPEGLIQSIRKLSKEHKKKPIIVITSEVYKHDLKRFKKEGANSVIIKPFDHKTLTDTIYKYLK